MQPADRFCDRQKIGTQDQIIWIDGLQESIPLCDFEDKRGGLITIQGIIELDDLSQPSGVYNREPSLLVNFASKGFG